jgi:replicative DNA helicase
MIQETEKALIGALLLSQKKIIDVVETVRAEDFSCEQARIAFIHIVGLWSEKKSIDLVSVSNCDRALVDYLASSTSGTYTPAAHDYAFEIAGEAKKRRILSTLQKISTSNKKNEQLLDDVLSLYQQEMSAGKKNPDILPVLRRFDEKVKSNKRNGSMGFNTGFKFLQEKYIQYIPGHIWAIGGWTSTGKTAVMIQKIINLINDGKNPSIVIISTEMTEEQIISRLVANMTGVHSYRILSENYHDEEEKELSDVAKSVLSSTKLKIYDDIFTLADIETAFRKADLQGGVDIGFVDYVQNIRVPEAKGQYQEQSEIAQRLQKLAKDVKATLVCLSQVSNDVGRGNTDLLELKGAGDWSAVADIGVMLKRHKVDKYKMSYEVKKNRHGSLCDSVLEFKAEYTSLTEATR